MPEALKDAAPPVVEATPVTETPAAVETVSDDKPTKDDVSAFNKGLEAEGLLPEQQEAVEEEPAITEAVAAVEPVAPTPAKVEAKPEDEAKAKVEKEITDLGIKNAKAADRFRELSARPTKEAVEAQMAPLLAKAQEAEQWQNVIQETQATPPQIQAAFGYLKAVNSKDPAQMSLAADAMFEEVKHLFTALGRDLPGVVDALSDYPDLAQAVANGEVTRAHAVELAGQRTLSKRTTEHSASRSEREQFDTALATASKDLSTLANHLSATDPQFAAKLPYLQPTLDTIKINLHPSKWFAAVKEAYAKIPAIQVAPPVAAAPASAARVPVTPMPIRPTGAGSGVTQVRKFSAKEVESGAPFALGMKQA